MRMKISCLKEVRTMNATTGNKSSSIKTVRIFVFIKSFVNFLSKHINKTEFFLRIIEGYFFVMVKSNVNKM